MQSTCPSSFLLLGGIGVGVTSWLPAPDPVPTAASIAVANPLQISSNFVANSLLSQALEIKPISNNTACIRVLFNTAKSVRIFVPRFRNPTDTILLLAVSAQTFAAPELAYTKVSNPAAASLAALLRWKLAKKSAPALLASVAFVYGLS